MGVILFHGINVRDSASILLPGSSELGVRVFCSFLVSFLVHIVFLLVKLNSPTICWALCSRGSALRLSIFCCAEPAVKQFFFLLCWIDCRKNIISLLKCNETLVWPLAVAGALIEVCCCSLDQGLTTQKQVQSNCLCIISH